MARIKYYDSTSASWKYADTNITSTSSVELDTTLTQSGKAADAKAVGDAISQISGGNVELDTTLTQSGKAADAKAVGDALAAYVLSLSTDEADAQANSDAVTAAIAEHKHVVLKVGKYPVKPGIVIESGKLDMNGAHFYTVDYKSYTPLVYLKGESPEICNGELEGSYDLADDEEGYSFFENERLICPEGVNDAYIHHMDLHNNWGYCISPGENVEKVYVESATKTGVNDYIFTTGNFDIPEGYKFVTAAGGIGYNYIISTDFVFYNFSDENGKSVGSRSGVPRKRIAIPQGAKTVSFSTKLDSNTFVPYYAYFTNYEETLKVADCTLHNFHSLGMANFPGPTTVTRCRFFESGKPRSEAKGTVRATTGGIDIEDIQTPEFIMSDCYSRDCAKMLMFGGYKGVISNCVGNQIGIYRGWQCDLSNCNIDHLYTIGNRCRISTNGVHADSIDIKESNYNDLRGDISTNVAHPALGYFDRFVLKIKSVTGASANISGRLNGIISSVGSTHINSGIHAEKGSRIVIDQTIIPESNGNHYGALGALGDEYGLISNAVFFPCEHTIHDSIFNISAKNTVYSLGNGSLSGGFKDCIFNLTGAEYFRKFTGSLTEPIDLTFENCTINNADNYLFDFVPNAGGTVTFKNCTIADENKLFKGDASKMTVNVFSGGNNGVDIDASLSVEGAAADAKAVGDALKGKQNAVSWELIYYGEITEDVNRVTVDKDSNGNAFSLKEYRLVIKTVAAAENQSNSFSWYSHNDDDGTAGPFYTILGADGGKTLVFNGNLCGDCMYCQYISDSGNTSPQSMRNALVANAVPVRKLNLYANSGNMCGAGTKIALFGVRA